MMMLLIIVSLTIVTYLAVVYLGLWWKHRYKEMKEKTMFYIVWWAQMVANIIFLLIPISYIIMAITSKTAKGQLIFLGIIILLVFLYTQKKNGIKDLIKDRNEFIKMYELPLNRRYSFKKRKEISKRKIKKLYKLRHPVSTWI